MKIGFFLFLKYFTIFFLLTEVPFLFTNYFAGDWDMVKDKHLIWSTIISISLASFLISHHYYRLKKAGQSGFTNENIKIHQVRTIDNDRSIEDVYIQLKECTHPKFIKVQLKNGRIELGHSYWTSPYYNFYLEKDNNDNLVIHFHPSWSTTVMDFGEAFCRVEQVVKLVDAK